MAAFEAGFGKWVIKLRWLIIATCVGLTVLAASGASLLSFTNNYRVFFSADNPQLLAFDALEQTYTKNDNVLVVLTPQDGDVFTARTLSAVEALTNQLWQTPYSSRVDSLSNFQHTEAEEDDLLVADLFYDAAALEVHDLEKIRNVALNEPVLVNRIVSADSRVTGINVTVQLPGIDETKEAPEVVAFVRNVIAEFEQQYSDIDVHLTGMVMMNNAFSESSMQDMSFLVPISFAVMLILLAILFKGFAATFGTLLVITFSIMSAMGIGAYIGFPLTPPSATAPTVILTVAIANSVHILITMLHEMRAGRPKHDAIVESLRVNLHPVFLASVTTAIGFLTMNFSDVPPFAHLGNFVAIGVLVSLLLSVTFLPALMSLLPVRVRVVNKEGDRLMKTIAEFVIAKRRQLLWGMAAVIALLLAFIPKNELNDNFVHYFDESVQFRTDSDYINDNLGGLYVIDYSLPSSGSQGINEPQYLKEVAGFAEWYRSQPEIKHVNVITDTFKRLNKNMHGDEQAWYRLPEEKELAAQYLLLYEMSLPYGLDLNNQINIDKSSTRMIVTVDILTSNELLALEQRAKNWLKENTVILGEVEGSGPSVMFAHIGKRNIKSMLLGAVVALLLISFILIFALRSLKIGTLSLVPNLVPAAMGFGLWGLLVGEVGLSLSIVVSMTLGIVVDDTVHFLSKYLRARRERGLDSKDAVRYAFANVGRALMVTSIVLVGGFLVLALSSFELNAGMGLLAAIVICFALIADFLFLPSLLIKLEERLDGSKKNDKRLAGDKPAGVTSTT